MSATAAPDRTTPTLDLEDAREALAYWEARAAGLPRRAIRDRREANEMARRSRAWVREAERAVYGSGLAGAVLLMAAELRLPEPARQAGRQVARRARQAALLAVAALVLLTALFVALLVALIDALV